MGWLGRWHKRLDSDLLAMCGHAGENVAGLRIGSLHNPCQLFYKRDEDRIARAKEALAGDW
jgi:hypothetical protein